MKKFSELKTHDRGNPCEEYPGTWFVYVNGNNERAFSTFEDAYIAGMLEDKKAESYLDKVTIAWKASDNDPRVGQVWFTGYYRHGQFKFGRYTQE
jgi:hypothetical protein